MTNPLHSDPAVAFELLEREVLAFIHAPTDPGDELFNDLALDLFAFQYEHNQPYANYCRSLDPPRTPDTVGDWRKVPAVPADAWKHFGLDLNTLPGAEEDFAAVFRTSGTTSERAGERGEHGFPSLHLYHASILCGWANLDLPELPMRFLTPSPANAPDSSLSHMMGVLDHRYNRGGDRFFIAADGSLEIGRLHAELARTSEAITIAGTALAFLKLIEKAEPNTLSLPAGSQLLETGGYKGVAIELDKAGLYEQLAGTFGVGFDDIHNEYSMTELSSQFYAIGLESAHHGPHWTRARVIDPESGQPAERGAAGHLEIVDLANLASCIALRTADLAKAGENNDEGRSFFPIGRDPTALPRGCSRSADEMLGGGASDGSAA